MKMGTHGMRCDPLFFGPVGSIDALRHALPLGEGLTVGSIVCSATQC